MGGYRLDGRNPLAYMGVKPSQPPQLLVRNAAPTANDVYNLVIGTLWVVQEKINPVAQDPEIYMLVNQEQNQATWVQIYPGSGTGAVESLTGNSGGAVLPTAADPANINILGTGTITVVGNPGTNTLTVTPSGDIASSFPTQSGTAVPSAGALTINGSGVIATSGAGSTVTITPSGAIASSFITNPATGTATPSSGVLTFAGAGATVVSAAGSTVTITSTDTGTTSFPTDSGTATPTAGAVNVLGGTAGRDINTSASGSTIHVDLNNAITLGDLSAIAANSNAISCTTGDINVAAGNIKLPAFNSGGTQGCIKIGGVVALTSDGVDNTWCGLTNPPFSTLTGTNNFSFGGDNLKALTTGSSNIAVGGGIANSATTATNNVAVGQATLRDMTTATLNVSIGDHALAKVTTGSNNTAVGGNAGWTSGGDTGLMTGVDNTLIGYTAGSSYTSSESYNIILGKNIGVNGESNVLRIGNSSDAVTKSFIQGIRGITTVNADAIAVLIDSAGQLGTVSSSIRFKDNVHDMGNESSPVMDLRPVTFEYKTHPGVKQYGLIAEEVAEHMPRLVVHDVDGNVESVKYHELPAILLNELQKLSKRVEELEKGCLCQK